MSQSVGRLGELLVASGVLTVEQCQQALQAQVMWGGRLGTNLIELGFVTDLDALSKALGRQHHHPAALARHFDAADPALQRMLATDVAERYACVPLMRVGKDKVIVAAMAPLDDQAREIVADELRVAPTGLLLSIAVELRIRYQLQRVYNIPRETRFLRSGKIPPTFPRFEIREVADDAPDLELPYTVTVAPRTRRETAVDTSRMTEVADPRESITPRDGVERRSYLPTLGTKAADSDRTAVQHTISLRRFAVGTGEMIPVGSAPTATLADAARLIKNCPARDAVAELVIQTVEKFVPSATAAILMVLRGAVATGWAGFTRAGAPLPEIVVPIDVEGTVPWVIKSKRAARGAADSLGAIDKLLLEILGMQDGDLVVVPIMVADEVMGVIAMATEHDASITAVETIAAAAGTAFTRMIAEAAR